MSNTVNDALHLVSKELSNAGLDNAAGDARKLVAHALGVSPDRLILALKEQIAPGALSVLDQSIKSRLERRPVSHIIGARNFWGRDFKVTPEVLDPRPETETLIEAALKTSFKRVLDLGTGSGCILLTLLAEAPNATGMGLDISDEALAIAVENRAAFGLERRAIFARSDWFEKATGLFDLIVANPPYISMAEMAGLAPEVLKWEPMSALTPGMTGLEAYEIISDQISQFLSPGGRVLLEVGPIQAAEVAGMFEELGLVHVINHKDMDGRERVVELQSQA